MSDAVTSEKTAAPGQWWVEVRGKAYGPYTLAQLSQFVTEGRVRPTTRVSDRPDGAWVEARKVIGLMHSNTQRPANDTSHGGANVFVHAEIRSGAWNGFMAALESMGAICELSTGLWLLRTRHSAGIIRNALSQTLQQGDRFVVVDATRDRFAWFNLGPEIDVRVAKVWNGPLRAEAIV